MQVPCLLHLGVGLEVGMDVTFVPHSQMLQPTNPIPNTCQMKYQQVLMLVHYLCRFST